MVDNRNNVRIVPIVLLLVIVLTCRTSIQQYTTELTLKQAIDLASSAARCWSRNSSLVYAVSTDAEETPSSGGGQDGKRYGWNMVFLRGNSQQNLLVAIRQGKVAYIQEVLMVYKKPIIPNKLRLDSKTALRIVKRSRIIKSPTAYHYELFRLNKTYLRVYCQAANGRYQILTFDEDLGVLCPD